MAITKGIATAANKKDDKAAIRQLIDEFNNALSKKDLNRMLANYASDVIVFDAKPPFHTKGAIAWKHTWEACLPYFPDSFQVEIRDLNIIVGIDMAIAHYIFRIVVDDKSHDAAQTWMRATSCYKKLQGKWKVVHEHGSVPFNPHTLQAVFTLDL
jgi:uncharacterized protein (TIGR02246 family)